MNNDYIQIPEGKWGGLRKDFKTNAMLDHVLEDMKKYNHSDIKFDIAQHQEAVKPIKKPTEKAIANSQKQGSWFSRVEQMSNKERRQSGLRP